MRGAHGAVVGVHRPVAARGGARPGVFGHASSGAASVQTRFNGISARRSASSLSYARSRSSTRSPASHSPAPVAAGASTSRRCQPDAHAPCRRDRPSCSMRRRWSPWGRTRHRDPRMAPAPLLLPAEGARTRAAVRNHLGRRARASAGFVGCRGMSRRCPGRSGGLPGGTRTPDLLLRRQLLYPVELRAGAAGRCRPAPMRLSRRRHAPQTLSACGTGSRRTALRARARR